MDDRPSLAIVLRQYLDDRGYRLERLARASQVREETIHHWLSGKVNHPYIVENLLRVAITLRLSRTETDRMLLAAGWPSVAVLSRAESDEERSTLLSYWQKSTHNNLPAAVASFVGREEETLEVAELLCRSDVRLVTLTGPGGIGKTRLSIEIARQVMDTFDDGVYLVPLSVETDHSRALLAIADVLNLREEPGTSLLDRLIDWLRHRQTLLLLDNLEQVVDAGPDIVAILRGATGCKVLVTSRIPLHVSGEHIWPVSPLPLPLPDQPHRAITSSPAVTLFGHRARAVNPRFRITPSNATSVVEICRRLDGMPLAIELAAARVQQFPPADLLQTFPSTLDLASSGPRDLPARQQALRATIAWSEQLLSERDRQLFARLGAFVGRWTQQAATAVCHDETLPATDIEAGLERLRDASLIDRVNDSSDDAEHQMLQTIREYAIEQLAASEDDTVVRRRHARHFLSVAEAAPPYVPRARRTDWYEIVNASYADVRSALNWSAEHEPATATRLSAALWPYWQEYALLSEGRHWLTPALAAVRTDQTALRGKLLIGAFYLEVMQGDYAEGGAHGTDGLQLAAAAHDHHALALALQQFGWLAYAQGAIDAARSHLDSSLTHWRALGSTTGVASCLNDLALFLATAQRQAEADPLFAEAHALYERDGDTIGLARSFTDRGASAMLAGDLRTAIPLLQHGVELCRISGDQLILPATLFYLGTARCLAGDPEAALMPLTESMQIYEKMGNRLVISLNLLAFAAVAHRQGQLPRAAKLCGAASSLQRMTGIVLAPGVQALYEQEIGLVRHQLEQSSFDAAFAAGERLSMSEAIALALE